MTNFDYYKDEIAKNYKKSPLGTKKSFYVAFAQVYARDKGLTYFEGDCEIIIDWLSQEHKEKIKLKQWEKAFIEYIDKFCYGKGTFRDYRELNYMKEMGHFGGITDSSMPIHKILENCEVVE